MRSFVCGVFALVLGANLAFGEDLADSNSADSSVANATNSQVSTELSDKINIISSTPLTEELSDNDLQKFVREGILDKDEAQNIKQNRNHLEEIFEENERVLVNIYRQIRAKRDKSSAKSSDSSKSQSESSSETNDTIAKTTDEEVPLLLENVYGHIGFFGKSNILNKSVGGSYGVFSASVGLQYDFQKAVFLDLGIYGLSPIVGGKMQNKYALNDALTPSYFVPNRASVKYVAKDEFQNEVFDITAGRFQAKRDWIRNFVQGVSVNTNYEWFKLWLDWVDEQAIAHREYLSDFNIFKNRYDGLSQRD